MRVALTGGATGIGASVASLLVKKGARVVAFDLNEPQQNIDQWIKLDLGNQDSIVRAISEAEGEFDALINNAGLPPRDDNSQLVLSVNYFGLRQFLDGMLDKLLPGSAIVNVASRAGSMWRDNIGQVKALMALDGPDALPSFISDNQIDPVRAYNLSKEAVIFLTQTMTEDLIKKELRINTVSPAAVSTGILDDFVTAFGEQVAKNVARAGRPGTPEEVASVICFLAMKESAWIKGQDIVIDGGMGAMAVTDQLLG